MADDSPRSTSRSPVSGETKDLTHITLRSATAEAQVDLIHGARLASLRIATGDYNEPGPPEIVEVLWGAADVSLPDIDPLSWGSFVMAPFAGRIRHGRYRVDQTEHQLRLNHRPHSIHGTVCDRPWELLAHTPQIRCTASQISVSIGPTPDAATNRSLFTITV
jgi:galactose mutarotase-like enzyme